MSLQTHKSFVRLRKQIEDILDGNWEACDCQTINTVKAQNSKDIVKIVHLLSVVQPQCYVINVTNSVRSLHSVDTLQKWHYSDAETANCGIKSYFFSLCLKKYSCSFITFRLNHWWQMDYFNDVFHTFLCLDCVIYLAVNGTVTRLPVFIQNMLHYYYYYNLYLTRKEKFTEITISFAGVTWPRWAAQVYKYITNNNNTINNKIR